MSDFEWIKRVHEEWIHALRNGGYQQGRKVMRHSNRIVERFCPLGVLMDIWEGDKWKPVIPEGLTYSIWYEHMGAVGIPHELLWEKYGLTKELVHTIIDMNDVGGHDFDSIADYLERRLWLKEDEYGLFKDYLDEGEE